MTFKENIEEFYNEYLDKAEDLIGMLAVIADVGGENRPLIEVLNELRAASEKYEEKQYGKRHKKKPGF